MLKNLIKSLTLILLVNFTYQVKTCASVYSKDSKSNNPETIVDFSQYLTSVSYFSSNLCDSSWAIATASALSDRIKRLRKGESPDIILSSQFLLSCDESNQGCKGGNPLSAYSYISREGIVEEYLVPYLGEGRDNGLSCSSLDASQRNIGETYRKFHILEYGKISGVKEMENALKQGTIVCGVFVTQEFIDHKKGIFSQQNQENISGRIQYVSILGYSNEVANEHWIGRHFFGRSPQNSEIFKIVKGKNILGIENECFYANPSTEVSILSSKTNLSLKKEQLVEFKSDENDIPVHPFIQEQRKLKPRKRYFMVFGPSQSGKSTFINTLLEEAGQNSQRAQVGTGNRNSTTRNIAIYKVGSIPSMFPNDIVNFDCIYLIDVPGTFDSNLFISDEEIFQEIKDELVANNLDYLDGILMFESLKGDSCKLLNTAKAAYNLFGAGYHDSTLVLSTKWDTVEESDLDETEKYLNSLLAKTWLRSMKWKNNYSKKKIISQEQMNYQLSELGQKILKLSPYKVKGIDTLLNNINERAEQIRLNDPSRFAVVEETIDIQVPEEFIEDIEMDTVILVKLTDEEIHERANELWSIQPTIPGGMIPDPSGKRNIVKRAIKIPEVETKMISIKTGMVFKDTVTIPTQLINWRDGEEEIDIGPALIEDKGQKLPKEFFVNILRNEVKTENVKKIVPIKKIRMKNGTKVIKRNQEKYDFEHYRKLALKEYNQGFLSREKHQEL